MTNEPEKGPQEPQRAAGPWGDGKALRNTVIGVIILLFGAIVFGVGALVVDLGERASVEWERFLTRIEAFDPSPRQAPLPKPTYAARQPEELEKLPPVRALTNPATWITPDDYPIEALRRDQQGLVQVFFVVSETGAVERCHIQESSGVLALDAQTCALITSRGRFAPVFDAQGRAVKSRGRLRFRWQIAE